MSNAHDRRAPGTARIPFDALVEVGGALGPSFEAQAVDLSEEGMSLRTAYLPEVGQPVMCRFDAGQGMAVVAAGEVLWNEEMGDGGKFGIRFTNLDTASTVALQHVLGMIEDGRMHMVPGRKVRLHIEGLASPMRARVKDQMAVGVTAYSELGFLQMGKPLELEDAASGSRRPALIDSVQVEVEEGSRIPQLVVSLRYDDAEGRAAAIGAREVPLERGLSEDKEELSSFSGENASTENEESGPNVPVRDEPRAEAIDARTNEQEVLDESNQLKSSFARRAANVTPALLSWAKRAKIAAALLAARARRRDGSGDDIEVPPRRTTAPAPGGGLHTAGRKVVRGSIPDDSFHEKPQPKLGRFTITKKRAAVLGSVGIAIVVVFIALRKPAPEPAIAVAPAPEPVLATAAPTEGVTPSLPAASKPVVPPLDPLAAPLPGQPMRVAGKATPFTNGSVGTHPAVIKIKMDGPIEAIQGAAQPTGFTIVIPNRKSIEPTESLSEKDARISTISVSNEAGGAEFSVTFKDGVPNYIVRSRGDVLEMVLAKPNNHGDKAPEAHTKKKRKGKQH